MRQSILVLCLCASLPPALPAQGLFTDHTPLNLRLETDLHGLLRDKGDHRKEHVARLHYQAGTDTGTVTVSLRTRGIFRRERCAFPPIRIDFPSHKVAGTPFAGQNKLKLATHCQSAQSFERNLIKEYALYRVFNAVTDTSFRVRLVHVTYVDTARTDTVTRYAFLIESDPALAGRLDADLLETHNVADFVTDPYYMTLVSVFQYLIGNTDWSVWGRHNIALFSLKTDHRIFAVPYDFDFSGAVGAPYATPPQQLPIHSVRERIYRGYCQPDTSALNTALARFRSSRDSIYAAVRAVSELPERDARGMLDYFDDFYKAIDNRGVVQRDFIRGCRVAPR